MPKSRPPYPAAFRQQMVELVRSGRSSGALAREFEPSAEAIRKWVAQAECDAGERSDGLRTEEREEIRRLRRENRRLREEREVLAKRWGVRTPAQRASSALCHAAPSAVSSLRAFGSIRISGRAVQRTKLPDLPDSRLGCLLRLETGNPHAETDDHQSPSRPLPRHIVSRRPRVPVALLFHPAPSRAEGGEERRTDHRIAAGRGQRLVTPTVRLVSTCPTIHSRCATCRPDWSPERGPTAS